MTFGYRKTQTITMSLRQCFKCHISNSINDTSNRGGCKGLGFLVLLNKEADRTL